MFNATRKKHLTLTQKLRTASLLLRLALVAGAIIVNLIPVASHSQMRGFVRKVTGSVTLKSSGATLAKRSKLQNGDIVTVAKGGSCVVALRSNGAQYRLLAGCVAQVGSSSVKRISGPALEELEAMDTGSWEDSGMNPMPRLLGNLQRSIIDADAGPMSPSPVEPVRTSEVKLSWKCVLPDTEGVKLLLTISETGEEKTLFSKELEPIDRDFTVPYDVLEPGLWYQWTVTVSGGDYAGKSCMGLVRIVPVEERKRLDNLERLYKAAHDQTFRAHVDVSKYDLPLARQYKWSGYWARSKNIYKEALLSRPGDALLKSELDGLEHPKDSTDE